MRCLVTGSAGFIGFHLARRFAAAGHAVCGIDGITPYYDMELKRRRHALLLQSQNFTAHEVMLEDSERVARIYADFAPEVVVHLAAQAGVRYSVENPRAYIDSNILGTFTMLELARAHRPRHLLIASTSSVYGANPDLPFSEADHADRPLSLYAATKASAEAMAHAYSHLWQIPTTAFRFFTVYGPWGRPDMALFKFTRAILAGEPIDIYNHGQLARDFTYIDDLIEAITRLVDAVPSAPPPAPAGADPGVSPVAPFRVVNIGAGAPVELLDFIAAIETATGKRAIRRNLPMQAGDVPRTHADTALLQRLTGFQPATPVAAGVQNFVRWYRDYYNA